MNLVTVYYYGAECTGRFMVPDEELESFLEKMEPNIGVKHDEPFVGVLNDFRTYDRVGEVLVD